MPCKQLAELLAKSRGSFLGDYLLLVVALRAGLLKPHETAHEHLAPAEVVESRIMLAGKAEWKSRLEGFA